MPNCVDCDKKLSRKDAKRCNSCNRKANPRKPWLEISGEDHPQWKGEKAGYVPKHSWLYRHYGKAHKCDNPNCKYPRKNSKGTILTSPKNFQWSNISGKYLREREDWRQLCVSCHKLSDLGLIKI